MEKYVTIFNNRLDDLVKISIDNRKQQGPGVLFLSFCDKSKMDCFYIPLNKNFPEKYIDYYKNKLETNPSSIIYFNLFDNDNDLNIEMDLDKKSDFLKQQNK